MSHQAIYIEPLQTLKLKSKYTIHGNFDMNIMLLKIFTELITWDLMGKVLSEIFWKIFGMNVSEQVALNLNSFHTMVFKFQLNKI